VVTALAFSGDLNFDPVHGTLTTDDGKTLKFDMPEGEELPEQGFAKVDEGYIAPAENGDDLEVDLPPASERLQLLEPFPAWDGRDFTTLPILIKTKGKTTTDHISPAGPWLKFRGHLDKISDNMFLGATNAFFDTVGEGTDVFEEDDGLGGKDGLKIAEIARRYKAKGVGSVVIGDENYGEGSSREHAAMSPRFLGVQVVIVRSFARIHETNLKKQGILPLTFANPADYDLFEQDDRVSVMGLRDLAPGQLVKVTVSKSHTEVLIDTNHSLTEQQIGWFKAGSALNALGEEG
jgi:aconitate hydratase